MMGFKAQAFVDDCGKMTWICFSIGRTSGTWMSAELNPTYVTDNVMVNSHL